MHPTYTFLMSSLNLSGPFYSMLASSLVPAYGKLSPALKPLPFPFPLPQMFAMLGTPLFLLVTLSLRPPLAI